jgi:hypothetical protein
MQMKQMMFHTSIAAMVMWGHYGFVIADFNTYFGARTHVPLSLHA